MKSLLGLKPYLLRYKKKLWSGFVFIIVTNLFAVIAPKFIGLAIDTMNKPFELWDVLRDAGFYFLFALLSGYFLFLVRQNIIVVSRHIEFDLKNDYYQHLQTLPRRFYNTTSTGDLISRGTNDLNAIREFLGPGIMYSPQHLLPACFCACCNDCHLPETDSPGAAACSHIKLFHL